MVIHKSNLLLKPTQTDITLLLLGPFSPPADYINHGYTKNYLGLRNTHRNHGYTYTKYTLGQDFGSHRYTKLTWGLKIRAVPVTMDITCGQVYGYHIYLYKEYMGAKNTCSNHGVRTTDTALRYTRKYAVTMSITQSQDYGHNTEIHKNVCSNHKYAHQLLGIRTTVTTGKQNSLGESGTQAVTKGITRGQDNGNHRCKTLT